MYQSIPNVAGVYLITNTVNGKVYVGSARRMRSRLQAHRNTLRGGKHHSQLLQRAWAKYGETTFVATVIRECAEGDLRAAEQVEMDARAAADPSRGYNLNPNTVPGRCMPHREETKRKIGAANKGKGSSARRGIPATPGARAVLSRNWKQPPAHVMEAAWAASRGNKFRLGRQHTDDARRLMSDKTRGELHPKAVLTESDVAEIRHLRAGGLSGPAIARRYGVHSSSVYNALSGKTWRHLAAAEAKA